MEKDPVLEKYYNEGFGKNAFGWYFNPWIDEYDENYDPHNDKEYNEKLNEEEIKWHPDLTAEQIEELIAEMIKPGDNEYDMYLWNHGIKPFKKEENKNKGGNDNLDQNQGKDKNTGKGDDEDKDTGKGDGTDKNSGKDGDTDKKRNLTSIEIDPISDLKLTYKYIQDNEEKTDKTEKAVSYNETYIENTKKIMERHGFKIENVSEAIDPNIIALLINNPEKLNFNIEDYLEMLNGKKDSRVKVKYSLKDIYKSELPLEEIKNIIKISKEARKLNRDSIQVDKDSFLKEKFENLKKFTKGFFRKRLPSNKKEKTIDLNKFASSKIKNSKYVSKHSKQSIISKTKSKAVSLGKETIGGIRILVTKLSGRFRGENKLVTRNKIRSITEKSFVPKAKVDEKAAVEKVNNSKGFTVVEKTQIKE